MDFKHTSNSLSSNSNGSNKNGNIMNGTYSSSNQSHFHSNSNSNHHLSNIEQHEMYMNSVKHSPLQSTKQGKLRRRCRSECLSPIPGQYHQHTQHHPHAHHNQNNHTNYHPHMERYNLRTHHHSNYYKDQDYNTVKNQNLKYYTNSQSSSSNNTSNGRNNGYTSSYLLPDEPSAQVVSGSNPSKENFYEYFNEMDLYNKKKAIHNKMQVDGVKIRYQPHQPQQQQQSQQHQEAVQKDLEDGHYRNQFYRRYRARSESESYDLYYQDADQPYGPYSEQFRSELKRTRDAISPPMDSNSLIVKNNNTNSPSSIPFNRSLLNNKSRHSVLVNNLARFSPKLKPRSPLHSYRNKLRALTPLGAKTTTQAVLRGGNFRHKSLSPTMLNNACNTPVSVASNDEEDNDADSNTLADEDCDDAEDDEPEPGFLAGDEGLDDDLTDPEDDYQATLSFSNSEKSLVTTPTSTRPSPVNSNCVHGGYIDTAPLAPSLFPYVPPYITFASYDEKGPDVPPVIQKQLKWKLTTITPILVRKVLFNTGFRLIKKPNDWVGTWGKHMKSPCFKTLHSYQKFNHLPGSFQIGRKDRCWRNLQTQMSKHGKKEFGFMPRTYIIPQDLNLLRQQWHKYSQKNVKWIIKPPASARGTGIRVVNTWAQIPKRKPLIVQR